MMRWIFHWFEGIEVLHIGVGSRWHGCVLGLEPFDQ
jgi:hypothetical protein